MKMKVEHTTVFTYDTPVYETATETRLKPIDRPESPQRCLEFSLSVKPQANITSYTDFYGNTVHHFNQLHSLQRLEIEAVSVVLTSAGHEVPSKHEEMLLHDFLAESHYVRFDPALEALANGVREIGEPCKMAEALAGHIHDALTYETGVTGVHSTTEEVMQLHRGVCQDFAHVMIGACRYLAVPARYVSGYLYGGPEKEAHDRASHAWCEIFCQPDGAWIGFDPTHRTLAVDERYIRIGVGRDYADVALVRGTFKGNAKEHLAANVRVMALVD